MPARSKSVPLVSHARLGSDFSSQRAVLISASTTIWSMAVSPRSSTLAVGCDDGSIRLLSLLDDDLSLLRSLEPTKTRILSVAWGPPPSQQPFRKAAKAKEGQGWVEDEADWLVAGCADSSLRKYDARSGRCLARMTVDKLRGEQTLVWAVAVASWAFSCISHRWRR